MRNLFSSMLKPVFDFVSRDVNSGLEAHTLSGRGLGAEYVPSSMGASRG